MRSSSGGNNAARRYSPGPNHATSAIYLGNGGGGGSSSSPGATGGGANLILTSSANDRQASSGSNNGMTPAGSITIPPIDAVIERYPLSVVWTPIPVLTWILPFVGHMGIADSEGVIHDFAGPFFISVDSLAFGNPAKYLRLDSYILPSVARRGSEAPATSAVPINGVGTVPQSGNSGVEASENSGLTAVGTGSGSTTGTPPNGSLTGAASGQPIGAPLPEKGCVVSHPSEVHAIRKYDDAIHGMRDYFRQTQPYNFFTNNCHSFVAYCLETGDIGKKQNKGQRTSWNMVKLAAMVFIFGKYVSVGRFLAAHVPFFVLVALIVGLSFI